MVSGYQFRVSCIDCVLFVSGVGDDGHCAVCGASWRRQTVHPPPVIPPPTSVTRYRVCACVVSVVLTVFCLFQVLVMIGIVLCVERVGGDGRRASPAIQSHAAPAIPPTCVRRYRVCINVM